MIRPLEQPFHRRQEIVLDGAAETSVVQFQNTALQLLLWTEPATANQIAIQTDTAEFIDDNGKPLATVEEKVPQNRGLASTEETGDHRDRQPLTQVGSGTAAQTLTG